MSDHFETLPLKSVKNFRKNQIFLPLQSLIIPAFFLKIHLKIPKKIQIIYPFLFENPKIMHLYALNFTDPDHPLHRKSIWKFLK